MSASGRLISKRAAAQQRAPRAPAAAPRASSEPATPLDWLVGIVAVVTVAVTGVKLFKTMRVRLPIGNTAVIYDARRRTIFATPMDKYGTFKEALAFCQSPKGKSAMGGLFSYASLRLLAGAALFPANAVYLTRPPLPWYKVFELPSAVLSEREGVEMVCAVADVPTKDGTLINMNVRVHMYIDLNRDLERYLSLCGPVGPSGHVGDAVGYCVRSHAATVDAGIIVQAARREKYFSANFYSHVTSKLLADCAIRVINVSIDRAWSPEDELAHTNSNMNMSVNMSGASFRR